ncbi:DUF1848 domain-containing protein [Lachnospiraceae bacterium OM04-12BH]|nr:DUF1848 domain-containing protein [Lachnospiraceae bacterium OM04-12BH]
MILNTGSRTDIPAYFSDWFYKRIEEGYVMVRNPYYPEQVTRYVLNPSVVDVLVFCTKNPQPMISRLERLSTYDMFWFVTITPYGREIEPFVPPKEKVIESFRQLSEMTGREKMSWRYDPVFITEKYSVDYHIACFAEMTEKLRGYTGQCVVSFLDLYEKTKRNFREARGVTRDEQERIIEAFAGIAEANGMQVPKKKTAREACSCLLGADIGVYNTCGHGCLYCYANYDRKSVEENRKRHDVNSPLLIGHLKETDHVKEAQQKSFKDAQMRLFL